MFEKLKQLNELRKMQDTFKKEAVTVEKRGVKVTMNGNFEVQDIALNAELSVQDQQEALKSALNDARTQIQSKLAKTLMGSGMMGM